MGVIIPTVQRNHCISTYSARALEAYDRSLSKPNMAHILLEALQEARADLT